MNRLATALGSLRARQHWAERSILSGESKKIGTKESVIKTQKTSGAPAVPIGHSSRLWLSSQLSLFSTFRPLPLDPQRTTERPGGVVRLGTVVTHEDAAITAVTIERAAEFPHISRRLHPTRRLRIELSELLQLSILFLGQKLDAHGRGHVHGGGFRSMFLPRFQPFTVVANTCAAFRAFR